MELSPLEQFFACYFNQDWRLLFKSADDAINSYCHETEYGTRVKMVDQLRTLLNEVRDDAELEEIVVNRLQCALDPNELHIGYRAWLREIADQVIK